MKLFLLQLAVTKNGCNIGCVTVIYTGRLYFLALWHFSTSIPESVSHSVFLSSRHIISNKSLSIWLSITEVDEIKIEDFIKASIYYHHGFIVLSW